MNPEIPFRFLMLRIIIDVWRCKPDYFSCLAIFFGGPSAAHIKSVHAAKNFFDKHVRGGYYARHATGMLLVGVIMYLLAITRGHYFGRGSRLRHHAERAHRRAFSALFPRARLFLKLLATSLTLGSRGSGGIFSPFLYRGATLGGAYQAKVAKLRTEIR